MNETDKRGKTDRVENKTKVATKCKWRKTLKAIKFHANKLIKNMENTRKEYRKKEILGEGKQKEFNLNVNEYKME